MKIEGTQEIKVVGEFKSITDFYQTHPNSKIEKIDDKDADLICEDCETAISTGDKYCNVGEGISLCYKCALALTGEENISEYEEKY